MGACTSRHEVLKNAGEAPLPAPANKEVEVIKQEVICEKQEQAPAVVAEPAAMATPPGVAADGDEAMRQSLHNLVNEDEEQKSDDKPQEPLDVVVETEKQVATTEVVEENKTRLVEASNNEKKVEEKVHNEETTNPTESLSERVEEEKVEENKVDDQKPEDKKANDQQSEKKKAEDQKSEEKEVDDQKSETKTTEDQKTTVSEERKPMFKLWF